MLPRGNPEPLQPQWVVGALTGLLLVLAVVQLVFYPQVGWFWSLGALLLVGTSQWTYRQKGFRKMTWTVSLLLAGTWILALGLLWQSGVEAPPGMVWVLVVAVSTLLFGEKVGAGVLFTSLVALAVLVVGQNKTEAPVPAATWLLLSSVLVTVFLFQRGMFWVLMHHQVQAQQDVLDRQRMEKAFNTSEARNRAILEALPDVVLRLSPEGVILDASIGEQANLPLRPDSLLRKKVQDLTNNKGTDLTLQAISWALAGTGMQTYEMELQHPTQGLRTFESRVVALSTEGVIMFLRDITSRKQGEEALRSSHERFEIVSSVTNDVMWEWTLKDNTLWWNNNFSSVFGYGQAPRTLEEWDRFTHPDDREEVGRTIRYAIAGGSEVWAQHYRFRRADGTYADVYDRGVVLRDAQGNPQRMIGAMMDLSEQRKAEQERLERLYRMEILDTVSRELSDVGLDPEGTLQVITRNAVKLLGDMCLVFLLSDRPGYLRLAAAHHPRSDVAEQVMSALQDRQLDIRMGLSGEVVRTGQPVSLSALDPETLQKRVRPEFRALLQEHPVAALQAVPMRAHGRVMGALFVLRSQDRPFTAEDQTLLQTLADRAGLTLSNARLYAENAQQAEQLRLANTELEQRIQARTQELAQANEQLQKLATQDGLTGLFNRRHFDATLEMEVRRAMRSRQPLSLILCDIDFFKLYNDNYGHPEGDQCLRQVAHTIGNLFRRAGDVVARYGGEEFAVILPNTNSEQAAVVVEKMRAAMQQLNLPHAHSRVSDRVTLSIGVSSARVADRSDLSPHLLIKTADEALYESKHGGRNRATFRVLVRERS